MRLIAKIIFTIVLFIFQVSFLNNFHLWGENLNLILVIFIYLIIGFGFQETVWMILLSGILLDLYSSYFFGLITLCLLFSLFTVYFLFTNFFSNRSFLTILALVTFGTVIFNIFFGILVVVGSYLGFHKYGLDAGIASFTLSLFKDITLNLFITLFLFIIVESFSKRIKSRFLIFRKI